MDVVDGLDTEMCATPSASIGKRRHRRGDVGQNDEVIFEVRWQHEHKLLAAGSYIERADAEGRLAQLNAMRDARGVTEPRYWIEEIDTTGLFELPSRPTPRERFTTRVDTNKAPGTWTTCHVEVLEGERVVASYDRNYAMLQTFEPFRQGDRVFALIAPDYTATSVMDLQTGEVVASEEPNSFGFCPVGFYVPDWWDVNDGSVLPGSLHWSEDKEWPSGDFGFVWGCVWGDDSSWKVQYLDLLTPLAGTPQGLLIEIPHPGGGGTLGVTSS